MSQRKQNKTGQSGAQSRLGNWAAGQLPPHLNYWRIFRNTPGGGRGSNGSVVWQRPLSLCRRMRSTTRRSVIKEAMRIRPPQEHNEGSVSKIFFINRSVIYGSAASRPLNPHPYGTCGFNPTLGANIINDLTEFIGSSI
jgi:hypothetical protein